MGGIVANTDREMLIEMSGKIDRVLDGQQSLSSTVHAHGSEIAVLRGRLEIVESDVKVDKAVRGGVLGTAKFVWILLTAAAGGVLAILGPVFAKHWG